VGGSDPAREVGGGRGEENCSGEWPWPGSTDGVTALLALVLFVVLLSKFYSLEKIHGYACGLFVMSSLHCTWISWFSLVLFLSCSSDTSKGLFLFQCW